MGRERRAPGLPCMFYGRWAVIHQFPQIMSAGYLRGHPNVRVFDGSWVEWGLLPSVPVEK